MNELVVERTGDSIEIVSADDEILISRELLANLTPQHTKIDFPFMVVRGATTEAWYELLDKHPQLDAWCARKIKATCLSDTERITCH